MKMLVKHKNISTHALTEGDFEKLDTNSAKIISTHALTEGDKSTRTRTKKQSISTHALTEGDSVFSEAG